jgi:hypothetical protein
MGFLSAAKRSANLVAFSIGGIFVATLTQERFAMAIAATASAVFAGWLVSFTLREPPVDDDDGKRKGSLTLLTDGLALLRDDRTFRRLVLLAVATVPFIDYLMNLYQPRFVDIGVPSIWLGLALALASGLSIVGARYAYWLEARFGTRTSLLLVTVLPGVLYLVLAAIVLPALAVLVFIVLYGSMSLKDPVFSGHLNRHIESSNRATVLSLVAMGSGIYVALLGLVIGQIAQVSLTYAFIFMGVVVIAGSLLFRIK